MNNIKNRINAIRETLKAKKLSACVIPTTDPHASEYVTDFWKDRECFSGFTGSAGTLVITTSDAGLWTDSRYFIQAEKELNGSNIKLFKYGEPEIPSYTEWLCNNIKKGESVLMNELRFSANELISLKNRFKNNEISLITDFDITATTWENRPKLPDNPILIHKEIYAGLSYKDKIRLVRAEMKQKNIDYLIINTLDEISWLLNIRGNDIEYNPVVISYLIISNDTTSLFIDKKKITTEAEVYFIQNEITTFEYDDFFKKNKIHNK